MCMAQDLSVNEANVFQGSGSEEWGGGEAKMKQN